MRVLHMGEMAHQLLSLAPGAGTRVLGSTSRGVFVHLPADWVLFLTSDPYHGPLTLNLDGNPLPGLFKPGDAAWIKPGVIEFPRQNQQVVTEPAEIWAVPPKAGPRLALAQAQSRFAMLASRLRTRPPAFAEMEEARRALANSDPSTAAAALERLLGRGGGLTPEGDDVICGLLLALERWGPGTGELGEALCTAARTRTTSLSASLIACAARGQADERLILALDGVMSGAGDWGSMVAALDGWGSSSGAAALAGMELALAAPSGAE